MCGLAGISLNPQDKKLNVREVSASLLEAIANRGPDATGAAWYDQESDSVMLTKVAAPVRKFLPARKDILPETTQVMILHTRFGTGGSAENRNNNHPIHYDNIVGVHNGVLWGDKEMWDEMGLHSKPNTQVDSEAIMALLSTASNPAKVTGKIKGDAALAWINLDEPEVLHLAQAGGRTLAVAQTEEGSLIFASTMLAVKQAATANGLKIEYELDVPDGKYLKVKEGVIVEYVDTPKCERNTQFSRRYDWTNGDSGYSGYRNTGKTLAPPARVSNTTTPAKAVAAAKAATSPKALTSGTPSTTGAATSKVSTRKGSYQMMVLNELVDLAKRDDAEAVAELLRRGYDSKGKYQNDKIDGISVVTLVHLAKNGSQIAYEALTSHGYDADGVRKLDPVPLFKEPAKK